MKSKFNKLQNEWVERSKNLIETNQTIFSVLKKKIIYFVSCEEFRKGPIETRTAKRWEVVADFVLSDVDPQVGHYVTSISL